jgi:Lipid A 3-O-deacylase (PagL)
MRFIDNLGRPVHHCVLVLALVALAGLGHGQGFAAVQSSINGQEAAPAALSDLTDDPPVAIPGSHAALPEAPEPVFSPGRDTISSRPDFSSSQPGFAFDPGMPGPWGVEVAPNSSERVPLSQCPYDKSHARECRVHWRPLIFTSVAFTVFLDAGNLYTGYWYRYETTHGKWFQRWIDSDAGWAWDQWNDGNPALDDYVGHPMMGSITNYMWIQNDPKGATVQIGEPGYWKSRMRAMAFTTAYHFLWKFGPFGEAAIGHIGDHATHSVHGQPRNDTGDVELITTPLGGLLWTIGEDALDKHLVKKLEDKPRRPVTLLLISFLTPSRATANIFRFRPPWYRDGRVVKAASFWSDPPGPEEAAAVSGDPPGEGAETSTVHPAPNPEILPLWPRYGGVHEFGAWWGLSLISGHIWGYAKDVKYMPVDVSYSFLWHAGEKWNLRYAPELTALAMLDEPVAGKQDRYNLRKRTYGSGVSPVGFRASFRPESRVQPFFSTDGGFIYFLDRVLSPQGSQFMYTIDFGGGLQIFHKQRQAVTIGYRYQHLSNANISLHNPGTDTNLFYVAMSRFRSKGYR